MPMDPSMGSTRRSLVLNHLILSNPARDIDAEKLQRDIQLVVGSRKVCVPIFCAHWCISRAQLYRYMQQIRGGCPQLQRLSDDQPRDSPKKDFVVTWFMQYAAEVTEKLPDCDKVLLPRMLWLDLHRMFRDDMLAAGHNEANICSIPHFCKIFNHEPALSHMEMTTFKRNFTKCSECVALTAEVTKALQGHDGQKIERAKAKRLAHYVLARSDKLHYWHQRWQVRL